MAAATNWVVPGPSDVESYVDALVSATVSSKAGSAGVGQQNQQAITAVLCDTVNEWRGAIRKGGRTALSRTAGSVPSECRKGVALLSLRALVHRIPGIATYVDSDAFRDLMKTQQELLEAIRKGEQAVEAPTDPDPLSLPPGVRWGADSQFEDMGTDDPTVQAQPVAVPPPPSDPLALAAVGGVLLRWSSWTPGVFNVYRGTASGGETLLAAGLGAPFYVDTGCATGVPLFYQVTSVNGYGESQRSDEVSATPL